MFLIGNISGFFIFLVLVVGVIFSLTGQHRSKLFFAGGFGALALTTMARQVSYIFMGHVMGGAYYGTVPWIILSILLTLMELAGFILLLVGTRSALSGAPGPVAGPPVPYGVPSAQPLQASAPPPGWGPVCAGCGTPAAPGQTQCSRCGGALQ